MVCLINDRPGKYMTSAAKLSLAVLSSIHERVVCRSLLNTPERTNSKISKMLVRDMKCNIFTNLCGRVNEIFFFMISFVCKISSIQRCLLIRTAI